MAGGFTPLWNWARKNARTKNEYVSEYFSEFFGTMVLVFFQVGAGGRYITTSTIDPVTGVVSGDGYIVPALGGILGLFTTILIFGGASGAHVNPAVSLGLAIGGKLSWHKVPIYWLAQMFGGYLGALIAYGLYLDNLEAVFGNNFVDTSASSIVMQMFTATPPGVSLGVGFADQIVSVAILLMTIYACIDPRNLNVPRHLLAFYIPLTVAALGMTFSNNAGAVLNPARDMCPRLAAVSVGIHSEVAFQNVYNNNLQHWWLVGFFAPFIGAIIGTFIYIFVIGAHLTYEDIDIGHPRNYQGNTVTETNDWRVNHFIPKVPPQQSMPVQQSYPQQGYQQGVNNNGYVKGPPEVYPNPPQRRY